MNLIYLTNNGYLNLIKTLQTKWVPINVLLSLPLIKILTAVKKKSYRMLGYLNPDGSSLNPYCISNVTQLFPVPCWSTDTCTLQNFNMR